MTINEDDFVQGVRVGVKECVLKRDLTVKLINQVKEYWREIVVMGCISYFE